MAPIVHIVDPDPDTVIVLKSPCTIFATWDPEDERQQPGVPRAPAQPDERDIWGSTRWALKQKKKKKSKRRVGREAHP
jgi:hypothetical protein